MSIEITKMNIYAIVFSIILILQGFAPAYISRKKGYSLTIQLLLLAAFSLPYITLFISFLYGQSLYRFEIAKDITISNAISCASIITSLLLPDKNKSKTDLYTAAPVANTVPSAPSPMSELIKYKELLDCGAISEEEYNAFKSEILK